MNNSQACNTLFIVDDHSMLKNGLKNYLEMNTQWKVSGAFSGIADCLAVLCGGAREKVSLPELIIIDIQLADGETGFSLVKTLKKDFPEIKIVLYSMYDTWGFILQAKDLGVQGYISKVSSYQ